MRFIRGSLAGRVFQIIQKDSLAVAVNPRRDESESVERSPRFAMSGRQVDRHLVAIQSQYDAAPAIGGEDGSVVERPAMGFPVRIDMGGSGAAAVPPAVAGNTVDRIGVKSL